MAAFSAAAGSVVEAAEALPGTPAPDKSSDQVTAQKLATRSNRRRSGAAVYCRKRYFGNYSYNMRTKRYRARWIEQNPWGNLYTVE